MMDAVIMAASTGTFALGGFVFADKMLKRGINTVSMRMKVCFAATFALSALLLELIIFEILDVLEDGFRHRAWRWTLIIGLCNLVIAIPIQTCHSLAASLTPAGKQQILLTLFLYTAFLVGFFFLERHHALSRIFSVSGAISRIGVVGVATIALLSGSGAVFTPFKFVRFFREDVSQYQIDSLQQQLDQSRLLLEEKKQQHARQVRHTEGSHAQTARQRGFFWSQESPDVAALKMLEADIDALETVNEQMSANLQELQQTRDSFQAAGTIKGRAKHLIGLCLSVYCVFKVTAASISVLLGLTKKTDPVTRFMQFGVSWLGFDIDIEKWSQQFSFILVGVIVLASTRNMLLKMVKAFSFVASSGKLRDAIVYLLVHIMGMYFVSMVILMRMNMPLKYRGIITGVLEDVEFNFYHNWFDKIFLLSAVSCAGTLYITQRTSASRFKF